MQGQINLQIQGKGNLQMKGEVNLQIQGEITLEMQQGEFIKSAIKNVCTFTYFHTLFQDMIRHKTFKLNKVLYML